MHTMLFSAWINLWVAFLPSYFQWNTSFNFCIKINFYFWEQIKCISCLNDFLKKCDLKFNNWTLDCELPESNWLHLFSI